MKHFLFAALALIAPLPAAAQAAPALTVVEVKEGPKGCLYRAEGRRMTGQQLEHRAKTWAAQQRRVEVHAGRNIPYHCVGTAMVIVQEGGVEKVSYVGKSIKPADVLLGLSPEGGCTPSINGEPVTMAALRIEAKRWSRDRAEVHFQPHPDSSFECVDSVLTVVKETQGARLSFIGNEQLAQ